MRTIHLDLNARDIAAPFVYSPEVRDPVALGKIAVGDTLKLRVVLVDRAGVAAISGSADIMVEAGLGRPAAQPVPVAYTAVATPVPGENAWDIELPTATQGIIDLLGNAPSAQILFALRITHDSVGSKVLAQAPITILAGVLPTGVIPDETPELASYITLAQAQSLFAPIDAATPGGGSSIQMHVVTEENLDVTIAPTSGDHTVFVDGSAGYFSRSPELLFADGYTPSEGDRLTIIRKGPSGLYSELLGTWGAFRELTGIFGYPGISAARYVYTSGQWLHEERARYSMAEIDTEFSYMGALSGWSGNPVYVPPGSICTITLDADGGTFNTPGGYVGNGATICLRQDAVGGRTIIWPADWLWEGGVAAVLSTAPGALDVLTLRQVTVEGGQPAVSASLAKGLATAA